MDIAPKTAVNPLAILLDNDHQLDTIYFGLMRIATLILVGRIDTWKGVTIPELLPIIETLKQYRDARDGKDQY